MRSDGYEDPWETPEAAHFETLHEAFAIEARENPQNVIDWGPNISEIVCNDTCWDDDGNFAGSDSGSDASSSSDSTHLKLTWFFRKQFNSLHNRPLNGGLTAMYFNTRGAR